MALRPIARISSATDSTPRHPSACSWAGRCDGSRWMPVTTTSAPSSASRSAIARPMPLFRAAPVTRATMPCNLVILFSYSGPFAVDENQFLADKYCGPVPIDEVLLIGQRSLHGDLHLPCWLFIGRALEPGLGMPEISLGC